MSVEVAFLLVVASSLIVCLVVLGTFVRVGQWAARLRHGGLVAGATGALALLGMWVAGALTIFGVVPWCLGFLWLVIDSLR